MYDKAIFLGANAIHIFLMVLYVSNACKCLFHKDEYWILNIEYIEPVTDVAWCGVKSVYTEKARTTIQTQHAITTKICKKRFSIIFLPSVVIFCLCHRYYRCDHHCHHLSIGVHTHTHMLTWHATIRGLWPMHEWQFYNVYKPFLFASIQIYTFECL